MSRKEVIKEEKDAERAYQKDVEKTSGAEIQPGCSAPNEVSPSVVGTSQDPKRNKED